MKSELKKILIVGSAPDALRALSWDTSCFAHRVVINNAWQACTTWDHLIYPEDFPSDRLPRADQMEGKKCITADEFVPVQNRYGGFVFAGGTMAFTAGYWALGALRPDVLAYLGCDMVYPSGHGQASHFYGNGTADPLRKDVTLQSLEAKSIRLMALAQQQGCLVVNLSEQPTSRLRVPRTNLHQLSRLNADGHQDLMSQFALNGRVCDAALLAEAQLGYVVPSGRYWEVANTLDEKKLSAIDDLWLRSHSFLAPELA